MPSEATSRNCLLFFLLLGWLWPTAGVLAREPDLTEVWKNLADSQNTTAQAALAALSVDSSRGRLLASAAVKMAHQPVTEETLRSAEADLVVIAQGDDELAALAGYLRARLYQVHSPKSDYARDNTMFSPKSTSPAC